jgi:DNA polymerase III alpha subunit (gram-positive type)
MKDEKLERFLNTINFNIDLTTFFEDAELEKVLLNKKDNMMTLIIKMDDLMPVDIFKELYETSKNFKNASKVHFKFNIKNNDKLLKEYFLYYFNILVSACPMLECIDIDKIVYEENTIDFEVLIITEVDKILSLKNKINFFS